MHTKTDNESIQRTGNKRGAILATEYFLTTDDKLLKKIG